jgi:predicted sugar kinase
MSNTRHRQRHRRRRLGDELLREVQQARAADTASRAEIALQRVPGVIEPDHGQLWRVLKKIEHSGECVWRIVEAIDCDDDEKAMIAQAVNASLAGMSRVSRRYDYAKA